LTEFRQASCKELLTDEWLVLVGGMEKARMKLKSRVSDEAVGRDHPAAGKPASSLMPSEHVIDLLGSDEWALVIEALAMGDTPAVKTRRLPTGSRVVGSGEGAVPERDGPMTIAPGGGA
jgi:hypothetical protein